MLSGFGFGGATTAKLTEQRHAAFTTRVTTEGSFIYGYYSLTTNSLRNEQGLGSIQTKQRDNNNRRRRLLFYQAHDQA
jgi:hypothetical protein